MTYVNAGHNPPVLVRAGGRAESRGAGRAGDGARTAGVALAGESELTTTLLTRGGPVIGLFDDFVYEQETLSLERGDAIIFYTDGVSEARDPRGAEFGEARLYAAVSRHAHLGAEKLMNRIIEELGNWCRGTPQHDDVTLVVVKVK